MEANTSNNIDWSKEYFKRYPNEYPVPLMEVMGNSVLYIKFDGDLQKLYKYCVTHKKTWKEVLKYKFDPNVLY